MHGYGALLFAQARNITHACSICSVKSRLFVYTQNKAIACETGYNDISGRT